MKKNRNVNYKVRLRIDDKGELQCIPFTNQQIPLGLFKALNDSMHKVVDRFNRKTTWKENYIKFTYNFKRYEQFDGKNNNTPCSDCIFRGISCQHPYYDTKGFCGKPYREVKMDE